MSRSSATSLIVRKASGALSKSPTPWPPRLAAAVLVAVNALLEDPGWLEHHDPARRNRNFLAGLGVAADPLAFLAHDERAERRELHRLAPLQTVGNFLKNQLDERR